MELKLKITIIAPSPGEEEEIIFRCHTLTDEMKQLVYRLEHGDMKLIRVIPENLVDRTFCLSHENLDVWQWSEKVYSFVKKWSLN